MDVRLSSRSDIIGNGVLTLKLGLSRDEIKNHIAWWSELSDVVCGHLGLDPKNLSDAATRRIYHCYLAVYYWMEKTVKEHKAASSNPAPLVVRMSSFTHKRLQPLYSWETPTLVLFTLVLSTPVGLLCVVSTLMF